ncbi:Alpha-ketoglutarate-dependent 2,4-dichlorophenoxyacetate dioxygenase [Fonsecaea pedrosoi]|nr:Alpha-ketoglutarate-dependent 2,4-dichlorophenoxyacetate dioxygenase [Fonsecaea pedrosoi]
MGSAGGGGTLRFEPLHATFVAQVHGVDWTKPIPDAVIDEIQAGIDKYGVLVFRAANIDNDTQVNFMRRFGELDSMPNLRDRRFPDQPHIFDVSNLDGQGNIIRETDRVSSLMNKGNQLWHTDMTYHPRRDKYSLLRAVEIPPKGCGGETEFADSRSAYEALSPEWKARLEDVVCDCSLLYNRREAAPDLYKGVDPFEYSISRWKAVYPHPGSGRKNLYLTSYAYKLDGYSVEESKRIADELIAHGTQARFVYKVLWEQPGDLVMWDNTAVWHRALDDSAYLHKYRRDMRRTNTFDDGEFAWGENEPGKWWHVKMPKDPLAHEKGQNQDTPQAAEKTGVLLSTSEVQQVA